MKIELEESDIQKITYSITQEVIKNLSPALCNLSDSSEDRVFTVETLAEYLQTTTKWVYNHIPDLPHFKIDGLLRFRKTAIDRMFEGKQLLNLPGGLNR